MRSADQHLTVTILTELVRRTSKHPEVPGSVSVIFDRVYAAERDHWVDLTAARYAAELAANESEHRVLGQTLARRKPANDLGFAEFEFDRVSQLKAALKSQSSSLGGARSEQSPSDVACPGPAAPAVSASRSR